MFIEKIDHLYIGFLPLISNTMHKFTNAIVGFRKLFPTFLFAKRWVHACIFLATKELEEENYDGILIEYGAYVPDCDNYENEVFFVNDEKNGLRYTEMTLNEFKRRMIQDNEGTGNIPFIKCNVNSINVFFMLIERAIFGKGYSSNPNLFSFLSRFTNKDLHNKFKNTYNGRNYDLIKYNCQCFVTKIIEASYATIAPFVIETILNDRQYYYKLEIDYENLRYYVPPNITEILERNEKLINQRKKEGKSRIVENNIKSFFDWDNFSKAIHESCGKFGLPEENESNEKTQEEMNKSINKTIFFNN